MSFTVSIKNRNISFDCSDDETVLEAAEKAGYVIPYSCRKGICSNCVGLLVKGNVMVKSKGLFKGSSPDVLLCQAKPRTDIEISPTSIRLQKFKPRIRLDVKVRRIEKLASNVSVLSLRLPNGKRVFFSAGQYLSVFMENGDSRNFSFANPPQKNNQIELHIRHVEGGAFSETILSKLEVGSILDVEAAYGEFNLSDEDHLPAIMIVTGTGFAPIKSIIESQIRRQATRKIHLFWGGNTSEDIYMMGLAQKWDELYHWFKFTPVVSSPANNWHGQTGLVHEAVQRAYPNMKDIEVYACGAPIMIEVAKRVFCKSLQLLPSAFFSDAFVPSGNLDQLEQQAINLK